METYCDTFYDWLHHVWPSIAIIVVIAFFLLLLVIGRLDKDA